jgi:hypothetical protein
MKKRKAKERIGKKIKESNEGVHMIKVHYICLYGNVIMKPLICTINIYQLEIKIRYGF